MLTSAATTGAGRLRHFSKQMQHVYVRLAPRVDGVMVSVVGMALLNGPCIAKDGNVGSEMTLEA